MPETLSNMFREVLAQNAFISLNDSRAENILYQIP